VGEFGVGVEGVFVDPFGMDEKGELAADGLEEMDSEAAGLGACGFEDANQLVEELLFFACEGFEADEDMKRHGETPVLKLV